ncbi:MAG: SpoIVB peptidase [Clostridia bacterium]|nr:SpoIVB peptidase [Clostridia bacterium]
MKNKKLLIAFLLFFLTIVYVYICAIDAIPKNTILFEGEQLNIKKIIGISLVSKNKNYDTILTSTESIEENTQELGTTNLEVKLFNTFNVKDIDVSVIKRTKVIPVGQVAGLKLYTTGVLVVGMSEIKGIDNKKYKPYENTGIQEGDTIVQIENDEITGTKELIQKVNSSKGKELNLKYVRDGEILECAISPVKTSASEFKLGLWVRDSAAGIGTMTYYEPETKNFAALGHGITDVDTGKLINISNGQFITTKVLSIIKGEDGAPGKIQGSISEQSNIGIIKKNSIFGIYGVAEDVQKIKIDPNKKMNVATRNEIELGEATILCSLDDEKTKEYKIQIEKIYLNNNYDNKSMLIKVTDKELIEKTGGIIQGMSGSPVIQNGKFIGAITNVLVNDPTKGYVVFGDLMIKEMRSIH